MQLIDLVDGNLFEAVQNDKNLVYGTNMADYDDKRVKYLGSKKSLYLVSKQGTLYVICSVNITTGVVTLSTTKDANAESQIRNPILLSKPLNIQTAYKYFDVCFLMLSKILKQYYTRLPTLVFTATNTVVKTQLERRFKMGNFKALFRRYRYIVSDYAKEHNGVFLYQLSNSRTKKPTTS